MNEPLSFDPVPMQAQGPTRRVLNGLTQGFALSGGLLLLALIGMSLISIVGRKLFAAPIRGDMELMQVGAAVAIAAFLPMCELRGNHLKADAFTLAAPEAVKRCLDALAHLLCVGVAVILAWRTSLQMLDSREYGDVTTLLSIPLWIPLLLIVPSLVLLALCALQRVADIVLPGAKA
ncbi:TRAP transporter small permease [Ectopseudomonas composti]|uniref:TRAP transporter small permease n=1 Tax=Ectopseudomonas composti TaxID=658457 RepID=UPI000773606D|nr:TRAP transporter small permease [Pseudomonas composti]